VIVSLEDDQLVRHHAGDLEWAVAKLFGGVPRPTVPTLLDQLLLRGIEDWHAGDRGEVGSRVRQPNLQRPIVKRMDADFVPGGFESRIVHFGHRLISVARGVERGKLLAANDIKENVLIVTEDTWVAAPPHGVGKARGGQWRAVTVGQPLAQVKGHRGAAVAELPELGGRRHDVEVLIEPCQALIVGAQECREFKT
jgi:hypothetical protein